MQRDNEINKWLIWMIVAAVWTKTGEKTEIKTDWNRFTGNSIVSRLLIYTHAFWRVESPILRTNSNHHPQNKQFTNEFFRIPYSVQLWMNAHQWKPHAHIFWHGQSVYIFPLTRYYPLISLLKSARIYLGFSLLRWESKTPISIWICLGFLS